MPRPPRVFAPGAVFHVYARVARGEPVFSDPTEASAFVDLLRELKARDGFTLFAWCLMSNHYHLALRAGDVLLWRTMASLQGRSAKAFNHRRQLTGPLWQGRYRSKLVQGDNHLRRLVASIHLNPVAAGIVADPADWSLSGHRELLGRAGEGLADRDQALLLWGGRRSSAVRAYRRTLGEVRDAAWVDLIPGRLPWWRGAAETDPQLEPAGGGPFVDALGRTTAPERPRLEPAEFLARAAAALGLDVEQLAGRHRDPETARARGVVALLAVERHGQRLRALALLLGKHEGSLGYAARRVAEARSDDLGLRAELDRVDAAISAGGPS